MGSDVGTYWSHYNPIDTDLDAHFFDQARHVDTEIFKARSEVGPQYGQFFVQQADAEERHYAIGIFANMS